MSLRPVRAQAQSQPRIASDWASRACAVVAALVALIAVATPQQAARAVGDTQRSTSQVRPLTPRANPDSVDTLSAARSRAERLRATVALLQARADWTNERLAYVRGQLAAAESRSVTAEQQLTVLEAAGADAHAVLAHRVRAIEQSGGTMALYTQALDGSSITEIASNIAALNAVLGTDAAAASDASDAAAQAAALQSRLADVADERTTLVRRAGSLAERAQRLLQGQQHALSGATANVRRLAHVLAREREAAAAAAAVPRLPGGETDASANPYGSTAVTAALSKVGSDYVWGAEGPDTFDCSGLVQWSYGQAGLLMPRLADDQYFASTPIAVSAMQPGDLIVYAYDPHDGNTIHHITMYVGNGMMVHAPHTGDVVRVVPVYYDGLYGVGRPGL